MKIVSWNLKNLGTTKLTNSFTNTFQDTGLGNDVLSYIINVVMGSSIWANINPPVPADIFVIIELKCGGHQKGKSATGAAVPVLQGIVGAMNTVVASMPTLKPNYQYNFVLPLIVGRHETVGIIYNTKALTLNNRGVLRDIDLRLINPRTPFWANFTQKSNGTGLNVIGIHAPPPGGAATVKFRNPINFARKVATVPDLVNPNTMVMGDYNCAPNSTYINGNGTIGWAFNGYQTSIPDGTLTSVRRRVASSQTPPANYLSGPYDNLLRNFAGPLVQSVLDTIGNARNVNTNPPSSAGMLSMVLNNYNRVSDHLAISMY